MRDAAIALHVIEKAVPGIDDRRFRLLGRREGGGKEYAAGYRHGRFRCE